MLQNNQNMLNTNINNLAVFVFKSFFILFLKKLT